MNKETEPLFILRFVCVPRSEQQNLKLLANREQRPELLSNIKSQSDKSKQQGGRQRASSSSSEQ